ncbi:uncharacterized protein GGS25DRAFT_96026 [Hypoxylon fragiforme]|uniref:uncharacterized protein n=1 Tax=Hypoxylon fragiforme TaxID=63214 RepID=UPI0020C6E6BB|nr:uncharacterized protein GGS25DRAFT_96026 [Hypoxylon fragiforme]KAI2603496.1 hypothetical protein GGS25DRAFT_96026 [Hypoxylon fragiforme]
MDRQNHVVQQRLSNGNHPGRHLPIITFIIVIIGIIGILLRKPLATLLTTSPETHPPKQQRRRPPPTLHVHRTDGYSLLIDILSDLRAQGTPIAPVVHDLIIQLYSTAQAAEEHGDHLRRKHARLQAEHAQLVADFNHYCGTREKWQARAADALSEDMRRGVDAAVAESARWREVMEMMFDEHLAMVREVAVLEREVAVLREEREKEGLEGDGEGEGEGEGIAGSGAGDTPADPD